MATLSCLHPRRPAGAPVRSADARDLVLLGQRRGDERARPVLRDEPRALARLLVRCHGRGWTPVSLRSTCDGRRCEVTMRLRVPGDRRGTAAQVQHQLERLVGIVHVAVDTPEGVPDGVAFAAVRRKAPWIGIAA